MCHAETLYHITIIYLFRSAIESALKVVTAYLCQFLKKGKKKSRTFWCEMRYKSLQRNAAHLHQTFCIGTILQVSLRFKEANLE